MTHWPLVTDRLMLRPWSEEDAPRLLDIRSRWEVARWLADPPEVMTDLGQARDRIHDWAHRYRDSGGRRGVWAIEQRSTGTIAGSVSLGMPPGGDDTAVEIGWVLHPDAEGRGLAREAAAMLLRRAFESGFPTVIAVTHVDNYASRRVAMDIGLRDLGVLHDVWYSGPSRQFALAAREYRAARQG